MASVGADVIRVGRTARERQAPPCLAARTNRISVRRQQGFPENIRADRPGVVTVTFGGKCRARRVPGFTKPPGRAAAKASASTPRAPGNHDRSTVRRITVVFPEPSGPAISTRWGPCAGSLEVRSWGRCGLCVECGPMAACKRSMCRCMRFISWADMVSCHPAKGRSHGVVGFSRSAIASGHCRPGRPRVPRSVMGYRSDGRSMPLRCRRFGPDALVPVMRGAKRAPGAPAYLPDTVRPAPAGYA